MVHVLGIYRKRINLIGSDRFLIPGVNYKSFDILESSFAEAKESEELS